MTMKRDVRLTFNEGQGFHADQNWGACEHDTIKGEQVWA